MFFISTIYEEIILKLFFNFYLNNKLNDVEIHSSRAVKMKFPTPMNQMTLHEVIECSHAHYTNENGVTFFYCYGNIIKYESNEQMEYREFDKDNHVFQVKV